MARGSRHVRRAIGIAALALAIVACGARPARAQALLERFDPAERGSRFFVADSLELDDRKPLALGLVTSYGSRLRTFKQSGADPEASDLVSQSIWLHPGASYVLAPGARVGIDMPLALQTGNDVALDRVGFGQPGSPRLGDLRASFDLRLAGAVRTDVDGATLGTGVSVYLPTGSGNDYASDDFARFDVRLASALRVGHVVLAARLGYMYRRDNVLPVGGVSIGSETNAVVAAGYRAGPITVGPEIYGSTTLDEAFQRRSTPIEALLGAHVSIGDIRVGAGLGTLLVSGLGAPKLRGVLSVDWLPSGAASDRDRDGVVDADDQCPDIAGLATGDRNALGCPAPPRDTDHDGVFDSDDACPDLPGIRTHDAMTHGCPDADRDGIPDPLDACPKIAGDRSVLPRYNGCPADADGDGVLDLQDACPDDPGVPTDDQSTNGCPKPPPPPDADGDGVTDADDACPDDKGLASTDAAQNGCPRVRVAGDLFVLARPLQLASAPGKRPVTFTPESEALLGEISAFLVTTHPEVAKVRIAARALGEAQAIVERLVALGVSRRRMEAVKRDVGAIELRVVK